MDRKSANYIGTVVFFDPAEKTAQVMIPALFGLRPFEASPLVRKESDLGDLPTLSPGERVTVLFDGGDVGNQAYWTVPSTINVLSNGGSGGDATTASLSASPPTDPYVGQLWVEDPTKELIVWNGTEWVGIQWGAVDTDDLVKKSGDTMTGILNMSGVAAGVSSQKLSLGENYRLYTDNTGLGTDNTRLWFDGQDGGEVRIGPRAGGALLDFMQLRTRTLEVSGDLEVFGDFDPDWTNATLLNSWQNYGGGYQSPRYRKVGDIVYIEGLIKDGTVGGSGVAFTMDADHAPAGRHIFEQRSAGSPPQARVDVDNGGNVIVMTAGSNAFVSLSGIAFSTK